MPPAPKHLPHSTPESLALIAAWLEDPSHLDRPPVQEFLSDNQTLQSLRSVAGFIAREKKAKSSNSELSASNDVSLPEDLTTASSTSPEGFSTLKHSQGASESNLIHENLPNQLRHKGVRTLLTEYYKMVEESPTGARRTANKHKLSFGDHLMRAAFPSLPKIFAKASVNSSMRSSSLLFSKLVVQFAFLLIPLWLYAVRLIALGNGGYLLAFLFGALGVLGFYFAERHHATACAEAQSRANKTIAAFYIEPGTGIPQEANNLLSITARCQEIAHQLFGSLSIVTGGASSSQGNITHSSQAADLNGGSNADYSALAQEIEDVRFAVLGERPILKQPNGSAVAELRNQISSLCETLGLECHPQTMLTASSMMIKLKEIRSTVGC